MATGDPKHRGSRKAGSALVAALFAWLATAPVGAADGPWRVLVLNGATSNLPAFVAVDEAVQARIRARSPREVEFAVESLDIVMHDQAAIEIELAALMRRKYRTRQFDVIIARGTEALYFTDRHREELWPGTPVVFHTVLESSLARGPQRPHATGFPVRYDAAGTVELGLRLRPQASRLVIVTGASVMDERLGAAARSGLERLGKRIEIAMFVVPSERGFAEMLAAQPADTLVLFVSSLRDGEGATHIPREMLARVAPRSAVPVLGYLPTYLGAGILGGSIEAYESTGRAVGDLTLAVLGGQDPSALGQRDPPPPACIVDWRELQRHRIDEKLLPPGCETRFREYSVLERYRWQIGTALAVILLQAMLIASLVIQRRRRRAAELEAQHRRSELAHASRLAMMGELTASIAHEINQPLGAILANADAADLLLEGRKPNLGEVRQILADIRRDDLRAGEVIRRLRALLARHETERKPVQLAGAVEEIVRVVEGEARRRGAAIDVVAVPYLPPVAGDRVQLQQVVLNLVLNAMDAMAETQPADRLVAIRVMRAPDGVEIEVADRGPGIAPDRRDRIFDSFFTTKPSGMGLGLAVARTIIEAHEGRIWAEANPGGGARFRIALPAAPPAAERAAPRAAAEVG